MRSLSYICTCECVYIYICWDGRDRIEGDEKITNDLHIYICKNINIYTRIYIEKERDGWDLIKGDEKITNVVYIYICINMDTYIHLYREREREMGEILLMETKRFYMYKNIYIYIYLNK